LIRADNQQQEAKLLLW